MVEALLFCPLKDTILKQIENKQMHVNATQCSDFNDDEDDES